MTVFKKKTELAKGVFWPSYLIGIAVIVLGIANQKLFGSILDAGLNWVSDNFGWWLVLFALILVLLVFGLAFSKAGDVVIGGAGAKPEYTMWQWFSMSLKGGIGTGILFWAMGEPIFHMAAPLQLQERSPSHVRRVFSQFPRRCCTGRSPSMRCIRSAPWAWRSWPTIGAVRFQCPQSSNPTFRVQFTAS